MFHRLLAAPVLGFRCDELLKWVLATPVQVGARNISHEACGVGLAGHTSLLCRVELSCSAIGYSRQQCFSCNCTQRPSLLGGSQMLALRS